MSNKIITTSILTIKGSDAFKIKSGKIVKVIKHKTNSDIGEILMRTTNDDYPFVGLTNGVLWGSSLENYEFLVLPFDTINLSSDDNPVI